MGKIRLDAFAIALLGSLFFPEIRGRIHACLRYVVWYLAQRGGEPRKTIVLMILAGIMRSLSACIDGRTFFEGCNLLLQLWAINHFLKWSDVVETVLGHGKKIDNHPRRLARFRTCSIYERVYIFDRAWETVNPMEAPLVVHSYFHSKRECSILHWDYWL